MAGQRRSGYTMFELIVVLTIIVITTALAVPLVDGMMGSSNLSVTADLIKSRLTEMQSRAREEGRAYKMTIGDDGASFKVEPVDPPSGEVLVNHQTDDQLPKDVLFRDCLATGFDSDDPDPKAVTEVVVYPDGTANFDYTIAFGMSENRTMVIRLRGQTGAVSTATVTAP